MKLVSSPKIYHEVDNHVETFVGGDSWTANKCTTAYEHFLFHTCSLLWLHKKIMHILIIIPIAARALQCLMAVDRPLIISC